MARTRSRRARQTHRRPTAAPQVEFEPLLWGQRGVVIAMVIAMATLFWRPATDHFGIIRATAVALGVLALVAMAVMRMIRTGVVKVPRSPAVWASGAFVATLVVALVAHGFGWLAVLGPYTRWTGVAMYVAYGVLLLAVVRSFDTRSVRWIAVAMIVALGVVASYGVLQVIGADPWDWETSREIYEERGLFISTRFSTIGNIDFSAAFVGITFPFALWGVVTARTPAGRWSAAAVAALAVVYVFGIEAFQGPVTLLLGSAVFGAVWTLDRRSRWGGLSRRARQLVVGSAVAVVALATAALLVYLPTIREELRSGFDERTQFWRAGMEMFTEDPLIGKGLGAYSEGFSRYRPVEHAAERGFGSTDSPHNVFVGFLAEGGLLLTLAFLAVVGVTGWALVRGLRVSRGEERLLLGALGGAWIAYLAQAIVSIDVPPLAALHWIIAGAIVVVATKPDVREIRVTHPRRPKRRRRTRGGQPEPAWMVEGVVVLVALVAVWFIIQPFRADIAAGEARQLRASGDIAGALDQFETATNVASWEGTYWALRTATLDQAGRLDEAVAAGIRAATEDEGNSFYSLAAAQLAERTRDLALARSSYHEALDRDPHNPEVMRAVAVFELQQGRPREAIDLLERAVAVRESYVLGWETLAIAYDEIGDTGAAARARERAEELDRSDEASGS